jgi:hypothetical protein
VCFQRTPPIGSPFSLPTLKWMGDFRKRKTEIGHRWSIITILTCFSMKVPCFVVIRPKFCIRVSPFPLRLQIIMIKVLSNMTNSFRETLFRWTTTATASTSSPHPW